MTTGIHPLPGQHLIAADDPRLAILPAPILGAGYLAKFGPVPDANMFWVSDKTTGPTAGMRVHGNPDRARANVITAFLEFEMETAELRREAEARRLAYVAGPGATNAGGVSAEMEVLDAR